MARLLERKGYVVSLFLNAGARALRKAVDAFGDTVADGSIVLLYYSGHGVSEGGCNFFVPVDAGIGGGGVCRRMT
jgi:uncharacterized caspase-like protein